VFSLSIEGTTPTNKQTQNKMKIKAEHYSFIRESMRPLLPKIAAYSETLKQDKRVKDFDMRLRWDWFNAAVKCSWTCSEVYPYANDNHIDTALRSIVSELSAN